MKPALLLFAPMLFAIATAAVAQESPKQTPEPGLPETKPPIESTTPEAPSGPPVSIINVPPPPDPNAFRLSSDVELVLLDVSVKDSDGGFVSDLSNRILRFTRTKSSKPSKHSPRRMCRSRWA